MRRKCIRNFINPLFHLNIVGMSYGITQNGWSILSPRNKKQKVVQLLAALILQHLNIEDDSGGLERLIGRKVAKERARKSKSKLSEDNNSSSTYFMKLFEEMKEEKKKIAEKKVTYMEKMVVVEQEKLVVEQEKVAIEKEKV